MKLAKIFLGFLLLSGPFCLALQPPAPFPTTMGELLCQTQGKDSLLCLDLSFDRAVCQKKFSFLDCHNLSGKDLCMQAHHTKSECLSMTAMQGLCLVSGMTLKECKHPTASELLCKMEDLGTWNDCQNVSEPEVMCRFTGHSKGDCKDITSAEVLCLQSRNDIKFCKGIRLDQIPCIKLGLSRDQMENGCDPN